MAQKQNFISAYKIFDVAAQGDLLRPEFNFVFFKNGYVYATDAHMLVRAKIADISGFPEDQIALLDGKAIHAKALEKLYAHKNVEIREDGFHAIEENGMIEIVYKFAPDGLKRVDFEAVLSKKERADVGKIGVNAEFLHKLTRAMNCTDRTRLEFAGSSGAIYVQPIESDIDIKGLVMPVIIDN